MTFSQLLREIPRHEWWREEAPGVYAFVGWPLRGFVDQWRYVHPKYLSLSVFHHNNDFFSELTPADEKLKVYEYIVARTRKNKNYLSQLRQRSRGFAGQFFKAGEELLQHLPDDSNRGLAQRYDRFATAYSEYMCFGAAIECVDVFSDRVLPQLLQQELPRLREPQILEIAFLLTAPCTLSFMEHAERLVLMGAIAGYKELHRSRTEFIPATTKHLCKKLSLKYYWVQNNFRRAQVLTESDYLLRMRDLARSHSQKDLVRDLRKLNTKTKRLMVQRQTLQRRLHLSISLRHHVNVLRYIGGWIDERKQYMTRANHYHELFCQEIARRFTLPLQDVKSYQGEDFERLLKTGRPVSVRKIHERRRFSVQVVARKPGQESRETIYTGRAAKQIVAAFDTLSQRSDVRGHVAWAPVQNMTGTVQVVLDVNKQQFKPGRILVTTMTRPEFIPLLRFAKAIITDEGGLTCHAAVVSRELNKLCIIGTKVATRLLKTGDRVEIDAVHGIVIKLSE